MQICQLNLETKQEEINKLTHLPKTDMLMIDDNSGFQ